MGHVIRKFAGAIAMNGVAVLGLFGQTQPTGDIVRVDPAMDKIVAPGAKVEKLRGDLRFAEGPVWIRSGGYLLLSDLMSNAIMKWSPNGELTVFRKPVFKGPFPDGVMIGTNGLTLDPQGRLVAAEHGDRRISRTEKDGSVHTLADRFEGKRLNSPNDVVVKKNGDVYFTDPPGLYRTYPPGSQVPKQELNFNGVFRISAAGKIDVLVKDVQYPNGLAFSPDEKKLYVSSSRPDKYWMVYDVKADGTLANGHKFADVTSQPGEGVPDGMKVDVNGDVFGTALNGVLVFSPAGKRLGTIVVPEIPSNCAWGDADGKTLYITARTGLYRIHLNVAGPRP